jgi:hypothetical protein
VANTDQSAFIFGPGSAWGVLTSFMDGTSPAVSQPRKFDVLQDFTLSFDSTVKRLMGSNIFPRAIGVGEGKVSAKIKLAKFDAGLWQLRWGEPAGTTTGQTLMADDESHTIPAATPFTVPITPPTGGTFSKDWGVRYGDTNLPLTAVTSGPTTGQYSLSGSTYTFATADASRPIVISYEYTVTTGATLKMLSHPQGQVALSSLRYQGYYGGRLVGVFIGNCVGTTINIPSKMGDFGIPEIDFECFADASGNVATLYLPA